MKKLLATLLAVATIVCMMPVMSFADVEQLDGKGGDKDVLAIQLVNDEFVWETKPENAQAVYYNGSTIAILEGYTIMAKIKVGKDEKWVEVVDFELGDKAKEAEVSAVNANKAKKGPEGGYETYEFKFTEVKLKGEDKFRNVKENGKFHWSILPTNLYLSLEGITGLKFNEKAQELVKPAVVTNEVGEVVTGAVVEYAVAAKAEDIEEWSETIPTATKAGKYSVWAYVDSICYTPEKPKPKAEKELVAAVAEEEVIYNAYGTVSEEPVVVEIATPVNTGDSSDMLPYALLLMISVLGCAGYGLKKRQH